MDDVSEFKSSFDSSFGVALGVVAGLVVSSLLCCATCGGLSAVGHSVGDEGETSELEGDL